MRVVSVYCGFVAAWRRWNARFELTRTSGLPANICSTAENNINRPTFFCTLPCTDANDTTTCGEAAKCTKNSLGMFGCVPQSCLDNLPAGCPL